MPYERMLDRTVQPSDADMLAFVGPGMASAWTELRRFLVETYDLAPVMNDGGKRYGWNIQHKKGGRPLCELYPESEAFTALVVLGSRELEAALSRLETFGPTVQKALTDTPRFHDGCWMYIRLANPETAGKDVQDIEQLILIKKKPPRKYGRVCCRFTN